MIIKKYAEYIPTVAEVYRQISPMDALHSICGIANAHSLKNLYDITDQEIKKRVGKSPTGAPNDVSLYEILQKDATALWALRDLYKYALEHRLLLFALSVQDMMLYYEDSGKNLAKSLLKDEYISHPSILSSNFGITLIVNLYREPSDDLSTTIETVTLQRFLAYATR